MVYKLNTREEIIDQLDAGKEVYYKTKDNIVEYRSGSLFSYGEGGNCEVSDYTSCFCTDDRFYVVYKNDYIDHNGEPISGTRMFSYGNRGVAMAKFKEISTAFFSDSTFPTWAWGRTDLYDVKKNEHNLPLIDVTDGTRHFTLEIVVSTKVPVFK